MARRVLIGGITGGIVLFVWQSITHLVLPLGKAGIKTLPNEDAVIAALAQNVKEPGFYFFPGAQSAEGMTREQKQEAMRKAEEKYRKGAHGIMVYTPQGEEGLSAKRLLTQLGADVAALLIAAFLLAQATNLVGFAGRVTFVALLGLLATFLVNVPYWNWYDFPASYTLAQVVEHVVGFAAAGSALAGFVKPRAG